jgi:hypothetical protein
MFGNQTPTTGQAYVNPAWSNNFVTDLDGAPPRGEFYDGFGVSTLKANQNLANGGVEGIDAPYAIIETLPVKAWRTADYHNQLLAGDEIFINTAGPPTGFNNRTGYREVAVARRQVNAILRQLYYERVQEYEAQSQVARSIPSGAAPLPNVPSANPTPNVAPPRYLTDKSNLYDEMGKALSRKNREMDPTSAESIASTWRWIGVVDDETKASRNPYTRTSGQRGNNINLDLAVKGRCEIINLWGREAVKGSALCSLLTRTVVRNRQTGEQEYGPFAFVPVLTGDRDQVAPFERTYQGWNGELLPAKIIFIGFVRDPCGKGPEPATQHKMLGLGTTDQIQAYELCRDSVKMKITMRTRFARVIEL